MLLIAALLAAGCGGADPSLPPVRGAPEDASLWQVPDDGVQKAVDALPGMAQRALDELGVPGMAIAVVHDDQLVFAEGFGVRRLHSDQPVDADTIFPAADLSVPVSATVVARAVEQGGVRWTDPVRNYLPTFTLSDPVTASAVTIEDLFAQRSGLPDAAGVLFADLGYPEEQVIDMLRAVRLEPFRTSYHYTEVGVMVAEAAVARAKNTSWEELARQLLFVPTMMTRSSLGDPPADDNRVVPHVRAGDRLEPTEDAGPRAELWTTARDLAQWMRVMLSAGRLGSDEVLAPEQVQNLITPRITTNAPTSTAGRAGLYGLGLGITVDEAGRVRQSHSGGSAEGISATLAMLPAERVGIAVLTNAEPTGASEAIVAEFLERVETGGARRPWLEVYRSVFNSARERPGSLPAVAPADARPMSPPAAYVGIYHNDLYGEAEVVVRDGQLMLRLGPRPVEFLLEPYDGDILATETSGDAGAGRQAVSFTVPPGSEASSFSMTYLEVAPGLGTFTRRR